ncbi:hypothetical protein A2U01_0070756, partial [Trifolium medium]|nr:hypothetical protein [Trifolium medium]
IRICALFNWICSANGQVWGLSGKVMICR